MKIKTFKMKKILMFILSMCTVVFVSYPVYAAADKHSQVIDTQFSDETFKEFSQEIINMKENGFTEQQIEELLNQKSKEKSSIGDIWNSLTNSEKKLVIRYPVAALKVNSARNIALEQTEEKFGYNGLGDRSDAFRHGIWNAEMTILIGKEKAELFATAHEDKEVNGVESDGFLKIEHKNMDLYNNEVGRDIGEKNSTLNETQISDIIYNDIMSGQTQFIWLHE